MAKKKDSERVWHSCKFYKGFVDEMPEEAKERMKAEKPEVYKKLFEKQEQQ